jgi:hypothetical protein
MQYRLPPDGSPGGGEVSGESPGSQSPTTPRSRYDSGKDPAPVLVIKLLRSGNAPIRAHRSKRPPARRATPLGGLIGTTADLSAPLHLLTPSTRVDTAVSFFPADVRGRFSLASNLQTALLTCLAPPQVLGLITFYHQYAALVHSAS